MEGTSNADLGDKVKLGFLSSVVCFLCFRSFSFSFFSFSLPSFLILSLFPSLFSYSSIFLCHVHGILPDPFTPKIVPFGLLPTLQRSEIVLILSTNSKVPEDRHQAVKPLVAQIRKPWCFCLLLHSLCGRNSLTTILSTLSWAMVKLLSFTLYYCCVHFFCLQTGTWMITNYRQSPTIHLRVFTTSLLCESIA